MKYFFRHCVFLSAILISRVTLKVYYDLSGLLPAWRNLWLPLTLGITSHFPLNSIFPIFTQFYASGMPMWYLSPTYSIPWVSLPHLYPFFFLLLSVKYSILFLLFYLSSSSPILCPAISHWLCKISLIFCSYNECLHFHKEYITNLKGIESDSSEWLRVASPDIRERGIGFFLELFDFDISVPCLAFLLCFQWIL